MKNKIILIPAIVVIFASLFIFSIYTYRNVQMAAIDPVNKADVILSHMARSVDKQALYALSVTGDNSKENRQDYYDLYAAIAAMNAVQENINTMSYGYATNIENNSSQNSNWAIVKQAGICGNHIEVFMRLLNKLHIKSRPVQFYNINKDGANHVAAEVFFNNKWNYFDVTWGTFFPVDRSNNEDMLALMSLEELLKSKAPMQHAVRDSSHLSFLIMGERMGTNPFAYLTSPTLNIIVNGAGTVDVYPNKSKDNIVDYLPKNIPNYFGSYGVNFGLELPHPKVSMTYHLRDLPPSREFVMNVDFNTCLSGSKVVMVIKDKKNPKLSSVRKLDAMVLKPGINTFNSEKLGFTEGSDLKLSTTTGEESYCLVGIKDIRFIT